MTAGWNAPMPDSIRHALRARQHPARAVACPHCHAHEHRPCTTPSKRRILTEPHPQRISEWVRSVAVCPECQVALNVPCHTGGWPLHDGQVHPQRTALARETPL